MIETPNALDKLESILEVEELDGVYVGPSDLGIAMGLGPSAWPDERITQAIEHVLAAAHARDKYAGIFCGPVDMGPACARLGYDLVTLGNDAQLLREAAKARIDAVRRA